MIKSPNILVIAGEASGDIHGAELAHEIKRIRPDVVFWGIGGDGLASAGTELIVHARDMAFLGFVEVIRHLPFIRRVFSTILKEAEKRKPDVAVLIDYPGFNIRIAKALKKQGIPIVYYISPQVWAWKERRKHTLAKVVDRMLVIFPFEESIYRNLGMDVQFVGNPLVDVVMPSVSREAFFQHFKLSKYHPTLCLLPGSRKQEVLKLLPPMMESVEILRKSIPELQCVLAVANTLPDDMIPPLSQKMKCVVVRGQTYDAMAHCHVAVVASGTATLETALLQTPMVIVYKLAPLSYAIGRHLVKVKNIGLVNIVAGKTLVPELIQHDTHPEKIAATVFPFLADKELNQRTKQALAQVRTRLGDTGASVRAARAVVDFIQPSSGK